MYTISKEGKEVKEVKEPKIAKRKWMELYEDLNKARKVCEEEYERTSCEITV